MIYRTDVIKSVPQYPLFDGEKYVGLGYKYMLIDQMYELLILNEPVCIVEYQLDGSSYGMYKQYLNNPKGWSFYRKTEMIYTKSLKRKIIVCAHYVASSIFSRNKRFIFETPCKILTILSIPLGFMLYLYIKFKVHNNSTYKLKRS